MLRATSAVPGRAKGAIGIAPNARTVSMSKDGSVLAAA